MSDNKITPDELNGDFKSLLQTTQAASLVLDYDGRVQFYTTAADALFGLSEDDSRDALQKINRTLTHCNVQKKVQKVQEQNEPLQKVVCDTDGKGYLMRIYPGRKAEGNASGVTISFEEFDDQQESVRIIRAQNRQETLATLGIYALEQDDLEAIMQRAIELSCIVLDLDCSVIYTLNKEGDAFSIGSQAGCAKEMDPQPVDEKWDMGYALKNDEATVVTSYEEEERFAVSPYMQGAGIVSSVHIVVRGTEDTYGLLAYYAYEERAFTEDELHFIQVVANIVGMSIQQQRSKEELRREVERSEKYQKQILDSNIAERWELGSYLHDNLAQLLASAKILIDDIKFKISDEAPDITEETEELNKILDESIAEIRDITHDIIPVDIEQEGVAQAFRFLMSQANKLYGVSCEMETNDLLDEIKDRKTATHLYHIVHEAVRNAAIHGEADNIWITFTDKDGELTLQIRDDGSGLPEPPEKHEGKGIRIMKHRMDLMEGDCEIGNYSEDSVEGAYVKCSLSVEYIFGEADE